MSDFVRGSEELRRLVVVSMRRMWRAVISSSHFWVRSSGALVFARRLGVEAKGRAWVGWRGGIETCCLGRREVCRQARGAAGAWDAVPAFWYRLGMTKVW